MPSGVRLILVMMGVALSVAGEVPEYTYRVVHTYPHDTLAFTQGLEYRDGVLYEGTGLEGSSMLRKLDLESGKVLQAVALEEQYFGEGITVLNHRIVQLTWQAHQGFVYDQGTFKMLRTFPAKGMFNVRTVR